MDDVDLVRKGTQVRKSIKEVFRDNFVEPEEEINWHELEKNSLLKRALFALKNYPVEEVAEFISNSINIDRDNHFQFLKYLIERAKIEEPPEDEKPLIQTIQEAYIFTDSIAQEEYLNALQWYDKNVIKTKPPMDQRPPLP